MAHEPVFLITGASSGIGAATARHAAEAGYRVVLAARGTDRLQALADELDEALVVRCDVTEWADQQAMVETALAEYGRLDVVFANAGFGAARGFTAGDVDQWKSMGLTNVYGAALTIRATIDALKGTKRHLMRTRAGAGSPRMPGQLSAAAKWARTAGGASARERMTGSGVRVTVVSPIT